MATLTEGLNPDYSYKAAALTGNMKRVSVEVEGLIDKEFWKDILEGAFQDMEFHFIPYSSKMKGNEEIHTAGKGRIMKNATTFNQNHIGCVDADLDWILPDSSKYGEKLINNKYLLHTYAYSIENLMCDANTFSDLCSNMTEESTNYDFVNGMKTLSVLFYPLLIWELYLMDKGKTDFAPTHWHGVLVMEFSKEKNIMKKVEQNIAKKTADLFKKYVDDDITNFEDMIKAQKGISISDACLFVHGHSLFSFIYRGLLKSVVDNLCKQHIEKMKRDGQTTLISQYTKSRKHIIDALNHNYDYKSYNRFYPMIIADAERIWETVG